MATSEGMITRLACMRLPSPRGPAALALLLVAALGCNQSLFDSNPDERDAGDGGDDGDDGVDPDGGVEPDAAPVSTCPEPCLGDALADFSDQQGGSNQRWFYLYDLGSPNGADYDELAYATWNGLDAWVVGNGGPAIASCRGQQAPECLGLDDFVLLVPGADRQRPALTYRVPETATYRLSGAIRGADGGPLDVPVQVLVSRAGRHDALAVSRIRTSESEAPLAALVPAIAGDEITVSIGSDQPAPPLGVRVFFTRIDGGGDVFPGSCQVALRFDPDDPLGEACRGATVMDLNDGIGLPGTSSEGPGPSARLGDGREFAEAQYLVVGGSPLDRSGDFTVQFWARITEPPGFASALFADWNDAVRGGIAVSLDDGVGYLCHMENGSVPSEQDCAQTERPADNAWHFWRVVRSRSGTTGTLQLCIDGSERLQIPLSPDANLTGDEPPHLARNVVYNPATFAGSLDEVRVFGEALPCVTN